MAQDSSMYEQDYSLNKAQEFEQRNTKRRKIISQGHPIPWGWEDCGKSFVYLHILLNQEKRENAHTEAKSTKQQHRWVS